MSDLESGTPSPEQTPPLCPQCGLPLIRKGKVVDFGDYKKWVDEWRCPTHGVVLPKKKDDV